MLPLLLLIASVSGSPLPESDFVMQSGHRVRQKEVPDFGGIEWAKSRRGVCYDSASNEKVTVGEQFYLACSRCTCDRYGFWCVPKCPLFYNTVMDNCLVVQEIGDKCCPQQECLEYAPGAGPPATEPFVTADSDTYTEKGPEKATESTEQELTPAQQNKTLELSADEVAEARKAALKIQQGLESLVEEDSFIAIELEIDVGEPEESSADPPTTVPSTGEVFTGPSTEESATPPPTEGSSPPPATNGRGTPPATEGSSTAPATEGDSTVPVTEESTTAPVTEESTTVPVTEETDEEAYTTEGSYATEIVDYTTEIVDYTTEYPEESSSDAYTPTNDYATEIADYTTGESSSESSSESTESLTQDSGIDSTPATPAEEGKEGTIGAVGSNRK